MRLPLLTLVAVLSLAAGSSTAGAKPAPPSGVHVDPGSPAAKEYAIPLSQARGGGGSTGSGSGQLFGRGITPAQGSAATHSTPTAPKSAPVSAPTTASTPAPAPVPPPAASSRVRPRRHVHHAPVAIAGATKHRSTQAAAAPAAQVSRWARPAGGGTGIAWMLGVAALVLALGGVGGAALARHGRRTSARAS